MCFLQKIKKVLKCKYTETPYKADRTRSSAQSSKEKMGILKHANGNLMGILGFSYKIQSMQ